MSLPSLRWPAKEAASEATPSIKSPSLTIPYVKWSTSEKPGLLKRAASEAHAVAEALAERTGRDLDARSQAALGMARRAAAPLAEALELVHRQVVAGQMEEAVQQDRAVAGGQEESVAVEPVRVGGIVAQQARPEHVGHRRGAERQSGVPAVRLLHGVDGQEAD